jgi:hypothetical protein
VEYVVLERSFPKPVTAEDVVRFHEELGCLDLYRVTPVRSYLMPDAKRMVCIFQAPDAEALRSVERVNGLPGGTVWSCSLHFP